MLDIQHASDWSNSVKLFNGNAAVSYSLMRRMGHFRGSLELVVKFNY